MQPLLRLTVIDVRRAEKAGSSRARTISKLVIPPVKLISVNHNPGGGPLSVDYVQPRMEPVEPAFSVKGFDTDIFDGFGESDRWTFAGAVRKNSSNSALPVRAIIEGVVQEWTPDEASPDEFVGCNHVFKQVTHLEFWINNEELIYADADELELRFKGKSLIAGDLSAAGITL